MKKNELLNDALNKTRMVQTQGAAVVATVDDGAAPEPDADAADGDAEQ